MRKAGSIPDGKLGSRFGDYLLSEGVANRVDPPEEGGGIWIHEDKYLERAKGELGLFLQFPSDAKYERASVARSLRKEREVEERTAKKRFVDVRTSWARQRSGGAAPVTTLLIAVCVAIFALGYATNLGQLGFATEPGSLLDDLARGELWRLVTPVLMHGGLFHLGFNMLWLHQLGGQIERQRGKTVFIALFLAIAVGSNFSQYFWEGPNFVGMSGVVYGLFGYTWMQSRFAPSPDLWVDRNTTVLLLGWMLLCVFGVFGGVANAAHVGGLIAGGILGAGPFLRRYLG